MYIDLYLQEMIVHKSEQLSLDAHMHNYVPMIQFYIFQQLVPTDF